MGIIWIHLWESVQCSSPSKAKFLQDKQLPAPTSSWSNFDLQFVHRPIFFSAVWIFNFIVVQCSSWSNFWMIKLPVDQTSTSFGGLQQCSSASSHVTMTTMFSLLLMFSCSSSHVFMFTISCYNSLLILFTSHVLMFSITKKFFKNSLSNVHPMFFCSLVLVTLSLVVRQDIITW